MNSKVALVTGASKGIGAAIALLLAKNKYKVIINYSKSDIDAKKVLKACNKFSESILIKADVTADKDCKKIGKLIKKKFGYINVLMNNAGKTKFVEFNDFNGLNAQDFIDIYKCNVISIFLKLQWTYKLTKECRTILDDILENFLDVQLISSNFEAREISSLTACQKQPQLPYR